MKIDKKASLQLSINAIVILVMAMVVLGLGLGFIRGLFGQGTEGLSKTLENNNLKNPAGPDQLVTIDKNIKLRSGGKAKVEIGYYNRHTEDLTPKVHNGDTDGDYVVECISDTFDDDGNIEEPSLLLLLNAPQVQAGESIGLLGTLSDEAQTDSIPGGTSLVCTLRILEIPGSASTPDEFASVQFFVDITG